MPGTRRRSRHRRHSVAITWLAMALLGLGQVACSEAASCTDAQAKRSVLSLFESLYLFNDEAAQAANYAELDLADFADAFSLLDELRYLPEEFDRHFSYITTPEAEEQYLEAGTYVGFGVMLDDRTEGELYVREVFASSPAAIAGLGRGDRILEIGGRSIAEIEAGRGLDFALGSPAQGEAVAFLIQPASGAPAGPAVIAKDVVVIDAVPVHDVIDVDGESVGYLLLHSFIEPAVPDLVVAFGDFKTAGITRLVVDLRYNGGGLLDLAATINDILGGWAPDVATGGPGNAGKVQYRVRFNADNAARDRNDIFYADDLALPLETIAFITSDDTASASELLINALGPYRDVYVVGAPTYGKPVGQEARDFCGGSMRLRLVTFDLVNVLDEGGYFDGLPVDCEADDDLGHPLGSVEEASLATALTVATTGSCPEAPMAAHAPAVRRVASTLGPGALPWIVAY